MSEKELRIEYYWSFTDDAWIEAKAEGREERDGDIMGLSAIIFHVDGTTVHLDDVYTSRDRKEFEYVQDDDLLVIYNEEIKKRKEKLPRLQIKEKELEKQYQECERKLQEIAEELSETEQEIEDIEETICNCENEIEIIESQQARAREIVLEAYRKSQSDK